MSDCIIKVKPLKAKFGMKNNKIFSNAIFFVYIYLDPRKPGKFKYGEYEFGYEPFYVGKGSKKRHLKHILKYILKDDPNKLKVKTIQDIFFETNKQPIIIKLKDSLKETDAFKLEFIVVDIIGRKNLETGPLTNLVPGGDGGYSGSSNPNFGNNWDDTQKENLRKQKLKYEYKLISPNNEIFYTNNLRKFCSDNNLGYSSMAKTVRGTLFQYKKWVGYIIGQEYLRKEIEENHVSVGKFIRRPEHIQNYTKSQIKYEYVLKSPFGEIYTTNNLNFFCEEHELEQSSMNKIVLGKEYHSKGWVGYIVGKEHLRDEVNKKNKTYLVISPDGIFYENIIILSDFCKDKRIGAYYNIRYNIKTNNSYKGWQFFVVENF